MDPDRLSPFRLATLSSVARRSGSIEMIIRTLFFRAEATVCLGDDAWAIEVSHVALEAVCSPETGLGYFLTGMREVNKR